MNLKLADDEHTLRNVHVEASLEDAFKHGPFDLIAFTKKAYDTVPAIFELQAQAPDPPPIICFQNGVGNEESLASAFGPDKVVSATLTTPVSIPEPGVIFEEKARGIAVALDSPAGQAIRPHFATLALTVQFADNGPALKWSLAIHHCVSRSGRGDRAACSR